MNKSEKNAILRAKIAYAKEWYKSNYEAAAERNLDFYRGKQWGEGEWPEMEQPVVNICLPIVRTILPSIFYQSPKIYTKPETPNDAVGAKIMGAALNSEFDSLGVKKKVRSAIRDCLTSRFGCIKTGWDRREEDVPITDEEFTSQFDPLILEATMAEAQGATGVPSPDDIAEMIPKTKPQVIEDAPFVDRISPKNIYIDPGCTDLDKLAKQDGYVVEQYSWALSVIKTDPRFKESVVKRLKGDRAEGYDEFRKKVEQFEDAKTQTLEEITYYEGGKPKVKIFAHGEDEPLYENDDIEIFPYEFLVNTEVPDDVNGMSEIELVTDHQRQLNRMRSIDFSHALKNLRKYLLGSGAAQDMEKMKRQLKQPIDGGFVEVDDINQIAPLPDLPQSQDVGRLEQNIMRDVEFMTQLSRYAMGGQPDVKRLATEVQATTMGSGAIMSDRLASVADFVERVVTKLMKFMQKYMTEDKWAILTGEDVSSIRPFLGHYTDPQDESSFQWGTGARIFNMPNPESVDTQGQEVSGLRYGPQDIQGNFRVKVTVGSTIRQDDQVMRQQSLDLFNLAVGSPYAQMFNIPKLWTDLLEAFGKTNPQEYLAPPPPPMPMVPPEEEVPLEAGGLSGGQGSPDQFTRSAAAVPHMMNRSYNPDDMLRGPKQLA